MDNDRTAFLNGCTVSQLKEFLQVLSLKTSGSKAELINRLAAVDTNNWISTMQAGASSNTFPPIMSEDNVEENTSTNRSRETDLMRREIELLRRENSLLERKNQLLQRSVDVVTPATSIQVNTSTVGIRSIADLLPDFTGESKAQAWFHSKPCHLQLSLNQIFLSMDRMFNLRLNKLKLRKDFEKRMWQTNETFTDYFHGKVILANQVPISEDELIDYVIDGVPDSRLRDQARMQRFETQEDILESFSKLSLSSEPRANDRRRDDKRDTSKPNASSTRHEIVRCYNCGATGHLSSACRRPASREKGSCFRCGSTQHRVPDCPKEAPKPAPKISPTADKSTNVVETNSVTAPYTVTLVYIFADEFDYMYLS
ncbi:hypothetical protein KPH14_012022 [Odynerus spinipes]|uniref:Gag protein n=1 Tax=Odynerus spinipes TaxID=1348599 RepID=A0AAD9RF50_9HYME|nr:hypothetical protein KPH14_012022 [Odynerus spinipes]